MRTTFRMHPLSGAADGRGFQSLLTVTDTIYCYFSSHGNRKQCSEQRMVLTMTLLHFFPLWSLEQCHRHHQEGRSDSFGRSKNKEKNMVAVRKARN